MDIDKAKTQKFNCKSGNCSYQGRMQLVEESNGIHHAKVICPNCGTFFDWVKKPEGVRRSRPASHRDLVARFGKGFCQMCLRLSDHLPKGETLEGHHVLEYKNGGEPTADNVWILCTACHSLVNWRRTYLRHIVNQSHFKS